MNKAEQIAKELGIEYLFPQLTKSKDVKYHIFLNNHNSHFMVLPNELELEKVRELLLYSDSRCVAQYGKKNIKTSIQEKIKECEMQLREISLKYEHESCDTLERGLMSAEEFAIQNQLYAYLECYAIAERGE